MLHGYAEIRLDALIGLVDDEIDAEGSCGRSLQALLDFIQPRGVTLAGALIQGREGAYYAGFRRLDHEVRAGDQKHRRRDGWYPQTVFPGLRNWHLGVHPLDTVFLNHGIRKHLVSDLLDFRVRLLAVGAGF